MLGLMLWLTVGVTVRVCLIGFNVFTQYVIRIETLVRGFCLERIFFGRDFVRTRFCPRDYILDSVKFWFQKIIFMTNTCVKVSNVCNNVCSRRRRDVEVM